MAIFNINNQRLSLIKEKSIDLEKDIQKLTEENLETVFNLQFVRTEFSLQNFRIDTLAFDKEANAFVIIEYKRDKSFSVIDQGYAYLALMLNNKADFILEYNEKTRGNLKREDIDWSQSRVLFLAQSFTTYQQNAINFRDLPIELWEVKVFDNSTILYNQLLSPEAKESIKTITKNKTIENVSREIKVYTLEDHLAGGSEKSRQLFSLLRKRILSIDENIKEEPKKYYIAYKLSTNFTDIEIRGNDLKIYLNVKSGVLNDPDNMARDLTKPKPVGHWGNGDYEVKLDSDKNLDIIFALIKQSYDLNK